MLQRRIVTAPGYAVEINGKNQNQLHVEERKLNGGFFGYFKNWGSWKVILRTYDLNEANEALESGMDSKVLRIKTF